ncbi:hypothetical protein SMSKK35_2916 [Stenotrophomonas maltophilia SKK35]|nr:hypothetical protein SMSKK35_2916 [Stenotrophomonas maltophilia SKK35]
MPVASRWTVSPRIAAAAGAALRIKIPDRQRAITPLVTLY